MPILESVVFCALHELLLWMEVTYFWSKAACLATYPHIPSPSFKKKNPLYFQTTDIFARWKTNSTFCQVFPDHTAAWMSQGVLVCGLPKRSPGGQSSCNPWGSCQVPHIYSNDNDIISNMSAAPPKDSTLESLGMNHTPCLYGPPPGLLCPHSTG